MAEIIPFKGIRYNEEKISDLGTILTPPYDVISREEQEKLYQLNEYNFIRIILGKEEPGDDDNDNKYTRADECLNRWLKEAVLKKDTTPSIYVYSQEFQYKDRRFERTGFVALLRLEEFEAGVVYPHEKTLSKPKEDRLRLLRATLANTEPIFALYEDPQRIIKDILLRSKERPPFIDVEYEKGTRHRLWGINDELLVAKIQKEMEAKSVYIADGHHRYETSLRFRNENIPHRNELYHYIMTYLVDLDDEGLMILPAHRLIRGLAKEELEGLQERIKKYFVLEEISSIERLLERLKDYNEAHAFGLYEKGRSTLLILKDKDAIDEIGDDTPTVKRLDVTILHTLVLGMPSRAKETEDKINYTISEGEAKTLVDKGEYHLAFFLNPTKISQVKEVALSGGVMPGKATYFYPKPLSGLVINKL